MALRPSYMITPRVLRTTDVDSPYCDHLRRDLVFVCRGKKLRDGAVPFESLRILRVFQEVVPIGIGAPLHPSGCNR